MTRDPALLFRRQLLFWSLTGVVLVLLLWLFSDILLPFLLGMAIAYFLDPVADWLERRGLSRVAATLVILILFIIGFAAVILIVVPLVADQVSSVVSSLPSYIERVKALVASAKSSRFGWLFSANEADIQKNLSDIVSQGTSVVTTLLSSLWTSSLAVVNFLSLFVVTPVVAFYLLVDWDRMVEKVDSWIPRQHLSTVRRLAREIDLAVAGFVRGQGSLCLILGTYYAAGLTLIGLNFGLLIGLFAGLISFIPYIGSTLGLVLAVGVALVQFSPDWIWVVATAAIFFSGQFFEGNILQPKLVGSSVGLHPVWLMFALFAFGALFGFVGLLIAVPAAAAVGVLVRFAITKYLQSEMYFGRAVTRPELSAESLDQQPLKAAIDADFAPAGSLPQLGPERPPAG
ncbi:AI-2E family transporter [Mangrovicella endophytica]|uniref:AI-2E family transporter n=1 Tax=Mangrovicella endophytica TaxID=2066697 RepID=UPI000C9EA6F1|nr:AI-2E family transporter [Mangrovicella endophytica]